MYIGIFNLWYNSLILMTKIKWMKFKIEHKYHIILYNRNISVLKFITIIQIDSNSVEKNKKQKI